MSDDLIEKEKIRIKLVEVPPITSQGEQKLLQTKAATAARISHPSVLPLHEFGFDAQGIPYVLTDKINEPTLADWLKNENISPETALDFSVQICDALACVHASGAIHGNLTADHVFILDEDLSGNRVKIGYFGVPQPDRTKKTESDDVLAFGRIMAQLVKGQKISADFATVIHFCCETENGAGYNDCREVLENLLLVRQGKLPKPPKARPGQRLLSLPVVAGSLMVAVGLTAILVMQFQQPHTLPVKAIHSSQDVQTRGDTTSPESTTRAQQKQSATERSAASAAPSQPLSTGSQSSATDTSSPETVRKLLTKANVKKAAMYGAITAAAGYKALDSQQKHKAQTSVLNQGTAAYHEWNNMSPQTKQSLKEKSSSVARKALNLWKRLPAQ